MALSTAIFVGEAKEWLPEIVQKGEEERERGCVAVHPVCGCLSAAKELKVSGGLETGADLGPLISPEAKDRVCSLIQSGVDEGAKVSCNGLL